MNLRALALIALVSGGATAYVLAGGGDPSQAQLAARAALRNPPTVVTPAPAVSLPTTPAGIDSSGGSSADSTPASSSSGVATSSSASAPVSSTPLTTSTRASTTTTTPTNAGLPKVKHVFLVALSTPSYKAAFGEAAVAPYLHKLAKRGTVLTGFRSLGAGELADQLAMVSGQAPNPDTRAGCQTFAEFPTSAQANAKGIVAGKGCVYPNTALTLADQTTSGGGSWGAYVADLGQTPCPVPNSNAPLDSVAGPTLGYDPLHNPITFFHSLLDAGACASSDQDLTALSKALRKPASTPTLSVIEPDACADGDPQIRPASAAATTTTTATSTATTAVTTTTSTTAATAAGSVGCPGGLPTGLKAEDSFLQSWVPQIERSAAYEQGGVIVIAFAGSRPHAKATGALVISKWTAKGKRLKGVYTPYSLLHSVEEMLGYTPLANAAHAAAFAHVTI